MNNNTDTLTLEQQIFEKYSVPKAVATMAIPTIISQVITVIYNLADTWYVGLTKNADMVAAVSLCLPVYTFMTAIANLFGIGGASVIARALGQKNNQKCQSTYSVAIVGALFFTLIYSLLLLLFSNPFLLIIGGNQNNIDYAVSYTLITSIIGSIPTIMSAVLAHLIRSTGKSRVSSIGITIGAILNIILDPLLMFVILPKGNELIGAALATTISNFVSLFFFIVYIKKHQENTIFHFSFPLKKETFHTFCDIIKSGIPSFLLVGASQISNFFLNGLIEQLGSSAGVAGMGVVRKIDSLAYSVDQGITQGMLPIVAYCYTAKKHKRMKAVILFSTICALTFSIICSVIAYIFAPDLVKFFIDDLDTIKYGSKFLHIMCIAVPMYPITFVTIASFQATNSTIKPFLLSLLRKGTIDITLFFTIKSLISIDHILWATPIAEAITLTTSIILFIIWIKKLEIRKGLETNF